MGQSEGHGGGSLQGRESSASPAGLHRETDDVPAIFQLLKSLLLHEQRFFWLPATKSDFGCLKSRQEHSGKILKYQEGQEAVWLQGPGQQGGCEGFLPERCHYGNSAPGTSRSEVFPLQTSDSQCSALDQSAPARGTGRTAWDWLLLTHPREGAAGASAELITYPATQSPPGAPPDHCVLYSAETRSAEPCGGWALAALALE